MVFSDWHRGQCMELRTSRESFHLTIVTITSQHYPINFFNATLTQNTATNYGGGIFRNGGAVNVSNSIVAGNNAGGSGSDLSGTIANSTSNILGTLAGATISNESGSMVLDSLGLSAEDVLNPTLADNGGPTHTHNLLPDGIAIDNAGSGATNNGQRSLGLNDLRDIGALEFFPEPSIPAPATPTPAVPFSILNGTPINIFTTVLEAGEGKFFIGNNSGRPLGVSSIDFAEAANQFIADRTSVNFDPNDGVTFTIRTATDLAPGFYSTTVGIVNTQTEDPVTFDLTATVVLPTAFDVAPALGVPLPQDTPLWSSGDDTLKGADIDGDGKQWLNGSLGDDLIFGNVDQDVLTGGPGRDTLYGGQGDDWLKGAEGDDFLAGDFGNDTLIGGVGSDRILIGAGRGSDVLLDFEDGIDKFELEAPLTVSQLTFVGAGNSTQIKFGDEVLVTVIGVGPSLVDAADFV